MYTQAELLRIDHDFKEKIPYAEAILECLVSSPKDVIEILDYMSKDQYFDIDQVLQDLDTLEANHLILQYPHNSTYDLRPAGVILEVQLIEFDELRNPPRGEIM